MKDNINCEANSVIVADPRYQKVKEYYNGKGNHYSDDYLINALALCRNIKNLGPEWYPIETADKRMFTTFLNHYLTATRMRLTESTLTKDDVSNLYATINMTWKPRTLIDRINLIREKFEAALDDLEKKFEGEDRRDIIQKYNKRGANGENISGFKRLMDGVFRDLETKFQSVDVLEEDYIEKHKDVTEEALEKQRKIWAYQVKEVKTMMMHKNRLAALAAPYIGEDEGFAVGIDDNLEFGLDDIDEQDRIRIADNEVLDTPGEYDALDYEENVKGDRYADFRTTKLINTASPIVRRYLRRMPVVSPNGVSSQKDDLGFVRHINVREALTNLSNVLKFSTPESMLDDIKKASDEYPWMKRLYAKLISDDADMRTLIFITAKKAEHIYLYTNLENQVYNSYVANRRDNGQGIVRNIGSHWTGGNVLDENNSVYGKDQKFVSKEEFDKRTKWYEAKDNKEGKSELPWIKIGKKFVPFDENTKDKLLYHPDIEPLRKELRKRANGTTYVVNIYRNSKGKIVEYGAGQALPEELKESGFKNVTSHMLDNPEDWMRDWLDRHSDYCEFLASKLRGIGIECNANRIKELAFNKVKNYKDKKTGKFTGANALVQLDSALRKVYSAINSAAYHNQKKAGSVGYNENVSEGKKDADYMFSVMQKELISLAFTLKRLGFRSEDVERRVISGQKSLSTMNNFSLMRQIVIDLANEDGRMTDEEYRKMLENDFLQYEGMAIGKGTSRVLTGWLKALYEHPTPTGDNGRNITLYDGIEFNHVDYEDMSRSQKAVQALLFYYHFGAYSVPIQSDYSTANNYVSFGPKRSYEWTVRTRIALKEEKNRRMREIYEKYKDAVPSVITSDINGEEYSTPLMSFDGEKITIDTNEIFDKGLREQIESEVESVEKQYISSKDYENLQAKYRKLGLAFYNEQQLREHNYVTFQSVAVDPREENSLNADKRDLYIKWLKEYSELKKNDQYDSTYQKQLNTTHRGMIYERNGHVYGSEIIEELADEVLCEMERMDAIAERQKNSNRDELVVYEKQGIKFQIFPEFNDNGFLEKYNNTAESDKRDFLRLQIAEQLEKIIDADIKTAEDDNIFKNPFLKTITQNGRKMSISLNSESGKFADLSEESQSSFIRFVLNTYFARLQMTKIFAGDFCQFKSLVDFEKRFMLGHAPHTTLDTKAVWKHEDGRIENVGKETQRALYIEDDKSQSSYLVENIKDIIYQLEKSGLITPRQRDTFIKAYESINTTDGQAFRSFKSYRDVMIMSGQWSKRKERAYKNIMDGHPKKKDINVFMQGIKPIYSGFEHIDAAAGEKQKPVKLTVLHKYSEIVLLPVVLASTCLQANNVPCRALENVRSVLETKGTDIDLFIFHSAVKVGYHAGVRPFDKWEDIKGKDGISDEEARKAAGWNGEPLTDRIINSEKQISDYIVNEVQKNKYTVHTLPFKYYGIAASMPAHVVNTNISWAAQAEKVFWADIEKDSNGKDLESMNIGDRTVPMSEARELYFSLKEADIVEQYAELRKLFADKDELEKLFQSELAEKQYTGTDLRYALAHLSDGTFSLPLYSPSTSIKVQQLLQSILRKRLTKMKKKGANILQSTGLGMDKEISEFDDTYVKEKDKLKIIFEGEGKNKHIKYVEVYLPMYDKRLMAFADSDGNIDADRLQELVDKKIIPEDMLYFIGYRTPSDQAHSIIPCKVKGFISNSGGATIRMPKEIMVMTGHDYDGDKMRCHFKNFTILDKDGNEIDHDSKSKPAKCVTDAYDYNKSPLDNSSNARANARIDLMFKRVQTPGGTAKMLIPGGAVESASIAKAFEVLRASHNDDFKKEEIANWLIKNAKIDAVVAYEAKDNDAMLYDLLVNKVDVGTVSKLIDEVINKYVTPYSFTHMVDSFEYIMSPAKMIGIYAMYNSTIDTLQRLDLHYTPKVSSSGKNTYDVSFNIDGKVYTIEKLCSVRNLLGFLESSGLSRLLNAAVDNGKDPILGSLNQCPQLAEVSVFLLAAGVPEEYLHILLNQPAVRELARRMKGVGSKGFKGEANDLIAEIGNDVADKNIKALKDNDFGEWNGLKVMKDITKDTLLKFIGVTDLNEFKLHSSDEEFDGDSDRFANELDFSYSQLAVLRTLEHIYTAASQFATLVRLMRPDSDSGSIGATVPEAIVKVLELRKFRETLAEDKDIRISGIQDFFKPKPVEEGWDPKYTVDHLGKELPEIAALLSLLVESSLDMMKMYFPQAKESWINVIDKIASAYGYDRLQPGVVKKIGEEMILWKLLQNKKFAKGAIEKEQKDIVMNVPKRLQALKQRISEAVRGDKTEDIAAKELDGNVFLENLSFAEVDDNDDAKEKPMRIQFNMNLAIEGSADKISWAWGELVNSFDPDIRQLGLDLFKYNIFTNGLSYGMYEFAHLAPFSVITALPDYVDALKRIENEEWDDAKDVDNFINQYYMNHWGDRKFLAQYSKDEIGIGKLSEEDKKSGYIRLIDDKDKNFFVSRIQEERYIIISDDGKRNLYRVTIDPNGVVLIPSIKLGRRNKHGQSILQYYPNESYLEIKEPAIDPNDSYISQERKVLNDIESSKHGLGKDNIDYSSAPDTPSMPEDFSQDSEFGKLVFLYGRIPQVEDSEKVAEGASDKNGATGSIPRSRLETSKTYYTRSIVEADKNTLYIFTDNTDRNSGNQPISDDSWYAKKYGKGHHYTRKSTTATIRGLDNARPVSTQRWYHPGATYNAGNWNDSDFEEFKAVIDDEFNDILEAWNSGKYTKIVLPSGDGLFNAQISRINEHRTPKLYEYLKQKVDDLREAVGSYEEEEEEETKKEPENVESNQNTQKEPEQMSREDMIALYRKQKTGSTSLLHIAVQDDSGKVVEQTVPASPVNVVRARRQKAFVSLNKYLRKVLRDKGISVGVLTDAEALLNVSGIAMFDTARVTAEGMLELIKISNDIRGEEALPEEFAHIAVEMLGYDNPLVARLLAELSRNEAALREAFGDNFDKYLKAYEGNYNLMIVEAAGKLIAKQMLRQEEVKTSGVKGLIRRIIDAIKSLFRTFSENDLRNAIYDAEGIANIIARDLLGGRLVDQMSLDNLSGNKILYSINNVQIDLSNKKDILSRLQVIENKKLNVYKKRLGYAPGSTNRSVKATESELRKLEVAKSNNKVEEAVVTYLDDAVSFVTEAYKSLRKVVDNGRSANIVCRKLNVLWDTICGFSSSIEMISEAIRDKEFNDDVAIKGALESLSSVLNKINLEYKTISMQYFEKMLAGVYGDNGLTLTLGKNKGRIITIHDMATSWERDISFGSRWINSIADCGEPVLMAMNEMVRDAKIRGRKRQAVIRPLIEKAIADLERVTGSRDQSFMFEYRRFDGEKWCNGKPDDGKLHKTGRFISEDESKKLTAAQKKFYDEMISIKKQIEQYMPEDLADEYRIIMLPKSTMKRAREANGVKEGALVIWDQVKDLFLVDRESFDPDSKNVIVDFDDNAVDFVQVKFTSKGKSQLYDDMTDDVAGSLLTYVGMITEYDELHAIEPVLLNARNASADRKIGQKSGTRTQVERISTDNFFSSKPFTKRQVRTKIGSLMEDLLTMQLYGKLRADEGTIGRSRVSIRKVAEALNAISSWSQMALNLPQRIANVNTGFANIIIESAGKGVYSAKDVAWAAKIWLANTGDRFSETGKTDPSNKLSLFAEKFDLHQDNGRDRKDYVKGRTAKVFNTHLLYAGLTIGEDYLALTSALACAKNFKVKSPSGNVETLWDAYKVKYADDVNKVGAYLVLKDGYTKEDGSAITEADELAFEKQVIGLNFDLQGIYNLNDKSAVQKYALGALVIMYRKWIAPALKRRYAGTKYNLLRGTETEGYYTTLFHGLRKIIKDTSNAISEKEGANTIWNIKEDLKSLWQCAVVNWKNMNDYERSNVWRAITEISIMVGLTACIGLMGKVPPSVDDDDRSKFMTWWDKTLFSQVLRLRSEIGSISPTPMLVDEATRMLRSPFAALRTVQTTVNILNLLLPSSYNTEIKSGRYKGHTKAYKYLREFPVISMFKKVENFVDPTPMINYYKNDVMM